MNKLALIVVSSVGCSASLDEIRGGSLSASVTSGDVATREVTVSAAAELAYGLRIGSELGGGRFGTEDGTHVGGGSFSETFGIELTSLFDAPAVARWLDLGPEAGLGFIIYRTPDETTPVAGSAFVGGWIDLHIGTLSSSVPGLRFVARREVRSELANETVFGLGVVWH